MNGVPLLGEHRMFCRFAPALTLYAADHATSLIALNATALDALTVSYTHLTLPTTPYV